MIYLNCNLLQWANFEQNYGSYYHCIVYIFCIGTCTIEHSSYIEEMNRTDQSFYRYCTTSVYNKLFCGIEGYFEVVINTRYIYILFYIPWV